MAAHGRGLEDVLHFFIPEDEQRRARDARRAAPRLRDGYDSPHARSTAGRFILAADPRRPLAAALAIDLITALGARGAAREILSATAPPIPWRDAAAIAWRRVANPDEARRALAEARAPGTCLMALAPEEVPSWLPALCPPNGVDGLVLAIEAGQRSLETTRALLLNVSGRIAKASRIRWIGAIAMGADDPARGRQTLGQAALITREILGQDLRELGGFPHDRASLRSLLRGQPVFEIDANAASARCLREIARQLEASLEGIA